MPPDTMLYHLLVFLQVIVGIIFVVHPLGEIVMDWNDGRGAEWPVWGCFCVGLVCCTTAIMMALVAMGRVEL